MKPLFQKILIANRGEIALRILRACRELSIPTVSIYSKADQHSLHVKLADEAICIGPAPAIQSYLHIPQILCAAKVSGADAIHPGYGFLSENANFAQLCQEYGICFIGPTPENIQAMGEKTQARRLAHAAKVPLLPGTLTTIPTVDLALKEAHQIGYPIVLKAAAGGGGKGIYIVKNPEELKISFPRAQSEAQAAFGNPAMYLEKYCQSPRHIEIQVACDRYGNQVALGERDCTIQRRHQKLIEEAPSPVIHDELRQKMSESALQLCRTVNYQSLGTIEFLVDYKSQKFYFMEMNTRVQVEHPVTEMITGIDLVKEQIKIAAGLPLSFKKEDIRIQSHAIECRINAEDPIHFTPGPGKITALHLPGGFGVRVETFVYHHYQVLPYYDSMIGKLIVQSATRIEAIKKMTQALDEFIILGIPNNILFQKKIINSEKFQAGQYDTRFLEEFSS